MADPVRILILEDRPADAELIEFELREAGLDFEAKVVWSEGDFVRELTESPPDLILSDYDLPAYNGAMALAEARRRRPEVPFILVTGAVTEDRAIEILTQGAKDYVLKSRLQQRLMAAVRRALTEAEEHRQREQAVEELHRASLYSRSLIEASLDPLVTISSEGKVMDVNRATEEITGVPREKIIGNDFSDYFTEPEKARAGYKKVFSEGFVKDYPLAIRHITGDVTEVLYNATTFINEKGEVQGVFAAARDVTELRKAEGELREAHRTLEERVKVRTAELEAEVAERKRAEKASKESDERQRFALETCHIGAWDLDLVDHTAFRSLEHDRIFGYGELLPKWTYEMFLEHVLPEDREAVDRLHRRAIETGTDWSFECRIRRRDGEVRWIWAAGRHKSGIGGVKRMAGIVQDITERRQDEQALRENQALLQSVMDSTTDPVYVKDGESRVIMGNEALARVVGKPLDEILGRTDGEYYGDDSVGQVLREHDLAIMASGRSEVIEEMVPTPQGNRVFLSNKAPYRNAFGRIIGILGISRDITERKQAEESILQAKKLSEALNHINESLHSTLNPGEVAQSLVNEGAAALGCDTAAISLRVDNGWTVSFVHGMPANLVGSRMTDDQERHALLAFDTCRPVAVADAFNDERFNRQHMRDHNIRAVVVAPLFTKGKPQGVIFFNYHAGPHAFTEPELGFVRHLASSASIALENSRQFGDFKQAGEVLKLQAQLLRESNQELERFSTFLSRDLRAPLQAIDGCSRMLLERQGDKLDAETRRQLEAIRDNVKSMARLSEDLLASSRSGEPR